MTEPFVFSGPAAWNDLASELASREIHRLFIVCGNTTWSKTGARERMHELEATAQLEPSVRFSAFSPNPTVEAVDAAYNEFPCRPNSLLVAIGGGSAIDVAKGVVDRVLASGSPAPLLAAIPTTAGSGSDATRFAVLYKDGKKLSLDRPELRPSLVVLDAALTASLPSYPTATTGLDAIAQAIESLWAVRSCAESDAFAREALSLLLPAIARAVKTGAADARAAMLRGAHLSGRAIDLTRTTAAHALSYAFTSHLGIPHGHAVWLTLPAVARYNAEVTDADCQNPRGAACVRARMADIARLVTGDSSVEALATRLERLADDLGIERNPFALGVADERELRTLLSAANPARLSNNPRILVNDNFLRLVLR